MSVAPVCHISCDRAMLIYLTPQSILRPIFPPLSNFWLCLHIHTPPGRLATARTSDSCLMLDYVRVINSRIIIIIIIITQIHSYDRTNIRVHNFTYTERNKHPMCCEAIHAHFWAVLGILTTKVGRTDLRFCVLSEFISRPQRARLQVSVCSCYNFCYPG